MVEALQTKDDPFSFYLGEESVLKAWDIAILSMTKGEKSIFSCSPSYSIGKGSFLKKIPEKEGCDFKIELLDYYMKQKTKWNYTQE